MKLYAISDLHVGHGRNRSAWQTLAAHPDDWLIVAGDTGESIAHLDLVLQVATERFARVLWVPGNHELWTERGGPDGLRGEAKYHHLVERCRQHGVLTPEDEYVQWPGPGGPCLIAPLFLLYDYTFRPPSVPVGEAVAWAADAGIVCADESFLHPDPHASRPEWCALRCEQTRGRLEVASQRAPLILVNHFPLRREQAHVFAIPRFSVWCGTERTRDWHRRFNAKVVVSGHIHVRSTEWIDGVRFEEVSLGYPRQWRTERTIEGYLREILPGPPPPESGNHEPVWYR